MRCGHVIGHQELQQRLQLHAGGPARSSGTRSVRAVARCCQQTWHW
eukprot:ctg_6301.g706